MGKGERETLKIFEVEKKSFFGRALKIKSRTEMVERTISQSNHSANLTLPFGTNPLHSLYNIGGWGDEFTHSFL
jgi:hypothetical protein